MKTFFKNKLVRVISFVLVLTSSFAFTLPGLVDWAMVARIREEGLQRSKVMEYESYIVDVLGARLTFKFIVKFIKCYKISYFIFF